MLLDEQGFPQILARRGEEEQLDIQRHGAKYAHDHGDEVLPACHKPGHIRVRSQNAFATKRA